MAVKTIQLLRQKNDRVIIVSIAGMLPLVNLVPSPCFPHAKTNPLVSWCYQGPSGAGKTSLAQKIAEVIPKSVYVSDYVKEGEGMKLIRSILLWFLELFLWIITLTVLVW